MTNSIPFYYIRFLKPPPTECLVGQHFTIVWTIESDLGDQTYWETVPVTLGLQGSTQLGLRELNSDPKGNSSKKKAANMIKPYMRQQIPSKVGLSPDIPLVFDPLRGGGIVSKLVIEQLPGQPLPTGTSVSIQLSMVLAPTVRSDNASQFVCQNAYQFQSQIWLIPTWSAPISASVAKQRHIDITKSGDQAERILKIEHTTRLVHIREDAVQSIARHVWDCGLGICQFLTEYNIGAKYDTFLELGSGTGLVGIYAAELLKPKQVYMTDLEDALEIMQQNVDLMNKNSTEMIVAELSWGPEKQERYKNVNLVLLADVLYNQSSHDLLLDTLNWLLDNNDCKALLAYKERNPDEREFFTKVNAKGWKCNRVSNYDHLVCEIYWIEK